MPAAEVSFCHSDTNSSAPDLLGRNCIVGSRRWSYRLVRSTRQRVNKMQIRLPRWLRIATVIGIVILAVGAGLFAYRYVVRPVTLTVAAGSIDGEAASLMSVVSSRLASTKAHIRLKVVDTGTTVASRQGIRGRRGRSGGRPRGHRRLVGGANTVVLLTHGVVMLSCRPDPRLSRTWRTSRGRPSGSLAAKPIDGWSKRSLRVTTWRARRCGSTTLRWPTCQRLVQSKRIAAVARGDCR